MNSISINKEEDWYIILSKNEKKLIQKGIEDLESGRVHSHKEVMVLVKKRIEQLKR